MSVFSPWRTLRHLPHISILFTDDDELLDGAHAWYYHRLRAIVMDSRLTQVERRSVLAHELGVKSQQVVDGSQVEQARLGDEILGGDLG